MSASVFQAMLAFLGALILGVCIGVAFMAHQNGVGLRKNVRRVKDRVQRQFEDGDPRSGFGGTAA
jgi:GMP synthase-like glutamine amidotransferase